MFAPFGHFSNHVNLKMFFRLNLAINQYFACSLVVCSLCFLAVIRDFALQVFSLNCSANYSLKHILQQMNQIIFSGITYEGFLIDKVFKNGRVIILEMCLH